MKKIIHLFLFLNSIVLLAQAPVIEGENILCINSSHTAVVTNGVTYDSYQWYSKFSYDETADFEPIAGAFYSTFTYGIDFNEQTIKLVTTLNGTTYESNEITLDTFWSFGVLVQNAFSNPETGYTDEYGNHFCDGDSIEYTVLGLYSSNVQWYKDDILLEGETNATLIVTEPGLYHAVCSTTTCPLDFHFSLGLNAIKENCETADTENKKFESSIQIYPNPTSDFVNIENASDIEILTYEVISTDGKNIISNNFNNTLKTISLSDLADGVYFIKLKAKNTSVTHKIIKK